MRGVARLLRINYKTVYRKFLWLSALAARQRLAQLGQTTAQQVYFDEMESIEHTRLKPLSIAMAIDDQYRILDARVAAMAYRGKLAALARRKYGYRPDEREKAMRELFRSLKGLQGSPSCFVSDAKASYVKFIRQAFPGIPHQRHLSRKTERPDLTRNKKRFDPIFPLNQRFAKLRAGIRRLARRSWCTTKKKENLQRHLDLYICFNNRWIDESDTLKPNRRPLLS